MATEDNSQDILVIGHRPQVALAINKDGDLVIDVSGIRPDFNGIEMNTVVIPQECIDEVISALNALRR